MTEVQSSQPTIQVAVTTNTEVTTAIDDDAYLLTLAEVDSLLPSTTNYFSGLFDGVHNNELNPDELSDIASLLAPPQVPVSDDEEAGGDSVSLEPADSPLISIRAATPVLPAASPAAAAVATGEIPILPKLQKPAIVSPILSSQKRSFVLQDDQAAATTVPPLKKAKTSKALPNTPILPALAPKPPSTTTVTTTATAKPLPNVVIQKKTESTASTTIKSAIAPSNKAQLKLNGSSSKASKAKTANASKATDVKPPAVTSTAAVSTTSSSNNNKPLTEEERAKQCRDRNRQHARNTRLRKKAYVEELKRQLVEMVEQRDAKLLEETQKAKIVEQQREVRFQVMQDFLQLRGRNEGNPHRWGAILEENFTLTLPKTNFQTMVVAPATGAPSFSSCQILCGVPDIMTDSAYFASFLQSLSKSTPTTTHSHLHSSGDDATIPTSFVYYCDRGTFLMDDCNAIMNWTATSVGAVQSGALRELELCGTMRARFCDQTNRLEKAEIHFDTGLVQSQLKFF